MGGLLRVIEGGGGLGVGSENVPGIRGSCDAALPAIVDRAGGLARAWDDGLMVGDD